MIPLRSCINSISRSKKIPNDYDYLSHCWAHNMLWVECGISTCEWMKRVYAAIIMLWKKTHTHTRNIYHELELTEWCTRLFYVLQQTRATDLIFLTLLFCRMQTVPVTLSNSLSEIVLCTCVDHFVWSQLNISINARCFSEYFFPFFPDFWIDWVRVPDWRAL